MSYILASDVAPCGAAVSVTFKGVLPGVVCSPHYGYPHITAHALLRSKTKGFLHHQEEHPACYPCDSLPSEPETRGLLTKPRRAEKVGEHDRGCQHLLPTIRLSILSPTVEMPFLTRCPSARNQLQNGSISNKGHVHVRPVIFSDNNNSDL